MALDSTHVSASNDGRRICAPARRPAGFQSEGRPAGVMRYSGRAKRRPCLATVIDRRRNGKMSGAGRPPQQLDAGPSAAAAARNASGVVVRQTRVALRRGAGAVGPNTTSGIREYWVKSGLNPPGVRKLTSIRCSLHTEGPSGRSRLPRQNGPNGGAEIDCQILLPPVSALRQGRRAGRVRKEDRSDCKRSEAPRRRVENGLPRYPGDLRREEGR
jgi:hypothetical protein